jgi:hypothetical protein
MTVNQGAIDDGSGQADDTDLRREGERIAQLIDDLGAIAGAPVRQRVEELVGRLVHLYGTGLAHLLRILGGDAQRVDDATRARLHADPLVSSLLVLHGLHPDPDAGRDFDPGPAPAAEPAPRTTASASGLVQIDLGRSRAAKEGGGSAP